MDCTQPVVSLRRMLLWPWCQSGWAIKCCVNNPLLSLSGLREHKPISHPCGMLTVAGCRFTPWRPQSRSRLGGAGRAGCFRDIACPKEEGKEMWQTT